MRAEIDKIRHGEHGARSARQAVTRSACPRRAAAGVDLPPPAKGKTPARTRRSAKYAYDVGQGEAQDQAAPALCRVPSKSVAQARSRRGCGVASGALPSGQTPRAPRSHGAGANRSARREEGGPHPGASPRLIRQAVDHPRVLRASM